MNINVNKQGYSLHVEVTMSPRQASQQKKRCDVSTVLDWLETHHPEYKKDIVSTLKTPTGTVSNYSRHLSGEWVFKLKQPPAPVVPVVPVVTIVEQTCPTAPVVKKKIIKSRKRKPRSQTKTSTLDEE